MKKVKSAHLLGPFGSFGCQQETPLTDASSDFVDHTDAETDGQKKNQPLCFLGDFCQFIKHI